MKLNVENPVYVLVYGAVVSGLFTAAIMSFQAAAGQRIESNEKAFEQKSLVELFEVPLGLTSVSQMSDQRIGELYAAHIKRGRLISDPDSGKKYELVEAVARTEGGEEKLVGYAFKIGGVGFWAQIDGWLAVSTDLDRLQGVVFISHSETPGLGGRITEKKWRDEFRGLSAEPPAGSEKIINIGPRGPRGHRVDAITGATGTSKAVESFLNDNLRMFRRAAKAANMGMRP